MGLFNEINDKYNFETKKLESKNNEIKIVIANDNSKYVINLSSQCGIYTLLFRKNDIDNQKVEIDETQFILLERQILDLMRDWDKIYFGEKNIKWKIDYKNNEIERHFSGNGEYPSNWNQFIDIVSNYESLYKQKCNS